MPQILVIDDDEIQRLAIVHILRNQGYEVIETDNGHVALRTVKETPVPLLVTDILMPNFDGIELIRSLRQSNSSAKIIAISSGGYADPNQFLSMAQRLGADATFAKPFRWDEFLATVTKLIGPGASGDTTPR